MSFYYYYLTLLSEGTFVLAYAQAFFRKCNKNNLEMLICEALWASE